MHHHAYLPTRILESGLERLCMRLCFVVKLTGLRLSLPCPDDLVDRCLHDFRIALLIIVALSVQGTSVAVSQRRVQYRCPHRAFAMALLVLILFIFRGKL